MRSGWVVMLVEPRVQVRVQAEEVGGGAEVLGEVGAGGTGKPQARIAHDDLAGGDVDLDRRCECGQVVRTVEWMPRAAGMPMASKPHHVWRVSPLKPNEWHWSLR